jgi:hypothetical protein
MSKKNEVKVEQKENGFRDGKDKDQLLKELLSQEDYDMIKRKRELDSVDKGTPSYKVLLQFDSLRRQRDQILWAIEQRFNDIESGLTSISRSEAQINSGSINEEIKPGVTMTEEELKNYVNKQRRLVDANVKDFINHLAPLRSLVGCHDAAGNVVLTEQKYDQIVNNVESRLRDMGYELFDEDIRNG